MSTRVDWTTSSNLESLKVAPRLNGLRTSFSRTPGRMSSPWRFLFVVFKGFFRTQPEAYSGDADGGFRTFLRPTFMIDVRRSENLIRKEKLDDSLPDLPWSEECFKLDPSQTTVLSGIWEEYFSRLPKEAFIGGAMGRRKLPEVFLGKSQIYFGIML